jgi:hypothetical protein
MIPRDFYRSPATPDDGVKHYRPTSLTRRLNVVMLAGGVGVMLWLARNAADMERWLAVGGLLLVAVFMAVGVAYVSTVRVAIDARSIVRTWLCGRRLVVWEDIRQLGLSQYKGSVSLVIRQKKKRFMSLSSDTFDWQDIRCMHRDILLALGLDTQPMWPASPRYLGFVDVEQVLRYKRFLAEDPGHGVRMPSEPSSHE